MVINDNSDEGPTSTAPTVFPTEADVALRDQLKGAFLSAHRGWIGNRPGHPIVQNPDDAQALATIAVLLFRKSQL